MTELKDAATETAERKRMDAIWWAGVLIWIGLALGAEYADILPAVGDSGSGGRGSSLAWVRGRWL